MGKLLVQKSYDYEYATTIKVRDINYGGHLGNDALVGLLHEARIALLNQHKMSEMDVGNGNHGIIMTELIVNYKKEGSLNDRITILSNVGDLQQYTFRIFHKVMREKDMLALAETEFATYNYSDKKVVQVPESIKQL
jgi:acyl-CoA thioesterase FadM